MPIVRALPHGLQVLNRGELAGLGRVLEVGGELVELRGAYGVALRLRLLRLLLETNRDLRGYLLELIRVLLLDLLEHAHELGCRRDLRGSGGLRG